MNPLFTHQDNIVVNLEDPSKRLKYTRDHGETAKNVHYGQLKLLLSEMYLLSFYREELPESYVLIYAGSSPGYHIPILVEKLPEISLCYCIDPNPTPLTTNGKFIVRQEYFTNDLAEELLQRHANDYLVFISDIRNEDESAVQKRVLKKATPEKKRMYRDKKVFSRIVAREMDLSIWENMKQQQDWMYIMRPEISLLKFRLPWSSLEGVVENNEVSYNDGVLTFQPFMTQRGTEAKLVVKKDEIGNMKLYNITHYEEVFSFHNRNRPLKHYRVLPSQHDVELDPPDLTDDWDSTAMYFTQLCYHVRHGIDATHEDILAFGHELLESIASWVNKHKRSHSAITTLSELRSQTYTTLSRSQADKRRQGKYVDDDD